MSRSSLLGTDHTPTEPAGRDTATLGPSDSSDSGSDMMGLADLDDADPAVPVDVGLREDRVHPDTPAESLAAGSDAGGTGERRSAASDAGLREGADIGVDRVFSVGATGELEEVMSDDEDLSLMDEAEAGDPMEDEDEDDEEDEDSAADRGRDRAALLRIDAAMPLPGQRPNPDPDPPDPLPDDDDVEPSPVDAPERHPLRVTKSPRRG